jgi:C2 domain
LITGGELPDPPDPYVKLYLMPGKRKKKKTQVVKDSGNPRYVPVAFTVILFTCISDPDPHAFGSCIWI